ncbi:MAG TPA: ATP-binding protein [Clostridia bacterium]|nr:ATP-binding protein [Clostridia bacterium]
MADRRRFTISLRTRLSLSYVILAIISVILVNILTGIFLDKPFREYALQNQEQRYREIVSTLSGQFRSGSWDMAGIENIGVAALEQSTIIKVQDNSGRIIWDATKHNNGICRNIIEQMAKNVSSRYPGVKSSYSEIPYPLVSADLHTIGTVMIGNYGPYYLNDRDLAFLNTLNLLLLVVGLFSILFALILGNFMAKRLSSPISSVIGAAQSISKGLFSKRITGNSKTREINQLTQTINDLADTMGKQELLRKRLTSDVAHELRTPLATLQSHMEAMIDGIWEPDTERLRSCQEEIVRIGKMVGDLEKLARYESENITLNREYFDLSELVKRQLQNFENEFLTKNITADFFGSEEVVYADRDKISQVAVNLLSNAVKYTQAGGRVRVRVKGSEDVTEFIVKDNGRGIPEEDLPYIFERFYRADKSRNRMTGGSGIGLTISKAIVEAHGGSIEVHSTIDVGSEFIVTLPKGTRPAD